MRLAFRMVWSVVIAGVLSGVVARATQAQQAGVSGVVVDATSRQPIAGAAVTLSGVPGVVTTDTAGRFQFGGVLPGASVLTATTLGYRFYTQRIVVNGADVALTIEMQRQVVGLPRVVVTGRDVTIKGVVRDSATRNPLLQASVTLYPGSRTVGTLSGRFSFDHVAAHERVTLVVEALEHLPETIEIETNVDTALVVSLAVDPVGRRMVAEQAKRLARRADGVPMAVDALGRADLEQTAELRLGEVLQHRLPYSLTRNKPLENIDLPCVFFDDRLVPFGYVVTQPIALVDRVEIFGRQAKMIRVYSRAYVASLMRVPTMARITFINSGLNTVCH
jgi:hypothetical protein